MRRAILAYDSSCSFCVETARSVESESHGKLDVSPLNSEEVLSLFARAGGQHGHRPALIQIDGDSVRVFEGFPLAAALTKRLGARRTYRVLQALGDSESSPSPKRMVSRKRFFSLGLGVTAAIGMLTAGAGAASAGGDKGVPRHKDATWMEEEAILSSTEIGETESRRVLDEFFASPAGTSLSDSSAISGEATLEVRGVRHVTESGSYVAVSATFKAEVLLVFAQEGKTNGLVSSTVFGASNYDDDGVAQKIQLLATSHRDAVELEEVSLDSSGGYTTYATCNSSACNKKGRCYGCRCTSWDSKCLTMCCATCALSCGAIWSCVACIGIWCPTCVIWAGDCCNSSACKYIANKDC